MKILCIQTTDLKKTISSFANEGIGKKHRFCDRNGADKLDGFRSMR